MRTESLYSIIAASFGALTIAYIIYFRAKQKRLRGPPKNAKWVYVGTVEEIAIHPIISGPALVLDEVQCKKDTLYSETNLKNHGLLLRDKKGDFHGTYPQLLSIKTVEALKGLLFITAHNMESTVINLNSLKTKPPMLIYDKGSRLHLVESEERHHEWFSKLILNKTEGLKLFLNVKTEFQYNLLGDITNFIPVMVINGKSVDYLNQRLSPYDQVDHLQFGGNILIKTADNVRPFDEDNWRWLRFGEEQVNVDNCILRYQNPCLRDLLLNINVKTCKYNGNFEPLITLLKYRKIHSSGKPTFGAYYKVYQEGTFRCNDPVYVIN